MKLSDYLRDLEPEQRETLADACGTSVSYLYQIAGGHRVPSRFLAEAIEKETKGKVSKVELMFGDAA